MKTAVYMAMAFGLASANVITTPGGDNEPCECEVDDLCYQAVQLDRDALCNSNYELLAGNIPTACMSQDDVDEACTCVLPATSSAEIVSSTETVGAATTETDAAATTTETEGAAATTTETEGAAATTTEEDCDETTTEEVVGSATDSASVPVVTGTDSAPTGTNSASVPVDTNTDSVPVDTKTDSVPTGTDSVPTGTDSVPTGTDSVPVPTGTDTVPVDTKTDSAPTGTDSVPVDTKTDSVPTGTQTAPVDTKTTEAPYTTKTVYTTAVNTYTKCPDYVKNCPAGGNGPYTVTETIAVSTTVCPVTEEHGSKPTGYTADTPEYTTKTVYATEVYTVTKCPPSVKDCPYGSVTTKTYPVSTTVCPVTEEHPSKPTGYAPVTEGHPAKPTGYAPPNTSTLYTTKTTYSTKVYTVTECGPEVKDCPYGSVKTETVPCTTVYATGTKEIPSYPTVVVPGQPEHPTPEHPETPAKPEHPAQPEHPEAPAKPEYPAPQHPETPAQPEHPESPAKPEHPEAPAKPEQPAHPEHPEAPAKPYPAPPAAETDSGYKAPAPSQPSATVPYHQPTGTAPAVEVTAGASRFGVEMAVAAAGIFAVLL